LLRSIIKEKKIKISIFLVTKYMGNQFDFGRSKNYLVLTSKIIKEMNDSGLVEFGSHPLCYINDSVYLFPYYEFLL